MSSDNDSSGPDSGSSRATITRRRFGAALAAGAAYAAVNPESIAGQPSVSPAQSELCEMTAVDLASQLARKRVSAREVPDPNVAL
jgi:hypothetical protein